MTGPPRKMYQRIICILADPNMQGIKIKHPKWVLFLLMRCMTKSYCCIKRLCNEIVTYLTIV